MRTERVSNTACALTLATLLMGTIGAQAQGFSSPAGTLTTLNFTHADFDTAVKMIQRKTGMNVVLIPAGKVPYEQVTLNLSAISEYEALRQTALAAGADMWVEGGTYYVGPRGSAPPGESVTLRQIGQPAPAAQSAQDSVSRKQTATLEAQGFLPRSQTDKLLSHLSQPIDVQLKDATVEQAAEALARATNIKITADSSIPRNDLRLTVEAQHVPLQTVLEGIANQADLMIDRTADAIVFRAWPSLNVNGLRTAYRGSLAPWSGEWPNRPSSTGKSYSFGGGFGGGFGGVQFGNAVPATSAPGTAAIPQGNDLRYQYRVEGMDNSVPYWQTGGMPGYSPMSGLFTMASMGDRLVIAEPGTGRRANRASC